MKKIAIILLLSIYSVSTLGLSLKSFYCCGNLKSVTVSLSQDIPHQFDSDNGQSDCCNTKYQFFKVKDNHVAADIISTPVLHSIYLHLFYPSLHTISCASEQINAISHNNTPPPLHGVSDYIFDCVFRI